MEKTNSKPCQTVLENKYETVSRRWKTNTKLNCFFFLISYLPKVHSRAKMHKQIGKTNTKPYQTVRKTNTKLYFLFTGAFEGIFGKKT